MEQLIGVPTWAAIIGIVSAVMGVAGVIGGAIAVARSKYRKTLDQEKDDLIKTLRTGNEETERERNEYIEALKDRNRQLELALERQAREIKDFEKELQQVNGKLAFLSELVVGKCKNADIDPDTGMCRHCELLKEVV